jgi:hypothetical protein
MELYDPPVSPTARQQQQRAQDVHPDCPLISCPADPVSADVLPAQTLVVSLMYTSAKEMGTTSSCQAGSDNTRDLLLCRR